MLARDWRAFVSLSFGFSVPVGDVGIFRCVVPARKIPFLVGQPCEPLPAHPTGSLGSGIARTCRFVR